MAILRNRKVAFKLWLMIIPAVILTVFFLYQLSYQSNKISKQAKETYNDIVYKNTALILNADRDIYQALVAEKSLLEDNLDEAAKEQYISDYQENYGQVKSRVDEAMENLQKYPELYNNYQEM
jgi:methyl-accepting chemotaxis protein